MEKKAKQKDQISYPQAHKVDKCLIVSIISFIGLFFDWVALGVFFELLKWFLFAVFDFFCKKDYFAVLISQ